MNLSVLLGGLLVCGSMALVACGDDTTTGGAGGGGSSAGGEAQGAAPQTGGGGSGGEGQGGEAIGGGGEGGQGTSLVVPTITDAELFGNCKPIVGPDPVNGSFTAGYANGGAVDAGVTVRDVTLALTGIDATLNWSFEVDPEGSGVVPAGDTIEVEHTKTADTGTGDKGDLTPCGYCGASGVLTVVWQDEAGATANATFPIDSFGCAF